MGGMGKYVAYRWYPQRCGHCCTGLWAHHQGSRCHWEGYLPATTWWCSCCFRDPTTSPRIWTPPALLYPHLLSPAVVVVVVLVPPHSKHPTSAPFSCSRRSSSGEEEQRIGVGVPSYERKAVGWTIWTYMYWNYLSSLEWNGLSHAEELVCDNSHASIEPWTVTTSKSQWCTSSMWACGRTGSLLLFVLRWLHAFESVCRLSLLVSTGRTLTPASLFYWKILFQYFLAAWWVYS